MKELKGILEYQLFVVSDTPVNVATLLIALAVAAVGLIVAKILEKATARFLKRSGVKDEGSVRASSRLVYYATIVVGITAAINTLGINLTALFAAGAFLAVAVGFAMQNIMQNFVSGLILLTERTIKPGDIIEVEGQMIRVTHMGIRGTVGRTLNDEDLIIPNSLLVTSTVKNFTLRDPLFRLRAAVGVSYGSDMKKVREVLEQTARSIPWRVQERDPIVLLVAFGNSSVDWEASIWVEDPFRTRATGSMLREAIWFALKDASITIAFPQVDVHFDGPVVESLKGIHGA